MGALSTSFTLGKASAAHGGNVEHNNREFYADNINVNKIVENMTYVKQDIKEAYDELFSKALEKYNAKQKQPCRKIKDYYEHIKNGNREEVFYELVVQFGDSKTAPVDSENGELVKTMLDEYMKSFKERNPNLHIFNAVLHMDEASPHLHIDVIPFYSENRKNGLSKGVSMKSALIEQGFNPKGIKNNQLVLWEDNERGVMENILKNRGMKREIKKANYAHQSVEEYKETQDYKKLPCYSRKKLSSEEITEENIRKLQLDNALLKTEKEKLERQKHSPYKSFYYSSEDKHSFVQSKLDELKIPYRETENGFEAQKCYINEIRKLEKEFKATKNPYREKLRNDIDKFVMQSQNIDEVLEKIQKAGYEIKQGKYLSVKPKFSERFIRLHSLGEDYSEQALRNRIVNKKRYETDIDNKINATKNQESVGVLILKTVRHYTVVFAADVLPANKINPKKPFSWTNDSQLAKLSALNKKLSTGVTLEKLNEQFASQEKIVAEKEKNIADLKSELVFFKDLYSKGKRCFENNDNLKNLEKDFKVLSAHNITANNYRKIEQLIHQNEIEIAKAENELTAESQKLKSDSDILIAAKKIVGGTYVQALIEAEKERRHAEFTSGYRRVD